ncbi:MAG: VCBS repeat-containing protein [candidate division WOR-3 bacterium]
MMQSTQFFILFILIIGYSNGISFRKVAELPDGGIEKALAFDTDHDGYQNLLYSGDSCVYIWEYSPYDYYFLETTAKLSWIYDIGYLDNDSLVDMTGSLESIYPYPLYVYESPTYYSNPTNIVWQDSGFMNIYGVYITDLDQDGLKEILFGYTSMDPLGWYTCVYENIADNQYAPVWQDTIRSLAYCVHNDFDLDGKTEFIIPDRLHVWECFGNDSYQLVYVDTLSQSNYIFSAHGHDMDGNGKPEFLLPCVSYLYFDAWLYLYEAVSDNNYVRFLIDSLTNLPFDIAWHESECGDIDGDGQYEIIWSTFNQWHIYKAIGIHQYQKIYSSIWTSRSSTLIAVYDLNGNGYQEVIESWYQNSMPPQYGTTIWEIQGVKILQPNYGYILHPGEDYQIIWQKFDPPGADSFALFFSSDNGNTYDTIAMGIPGNDTTYQ